MFEPEVDEKLSESSESAESPSHEQPAASSTPPTDVVQASQAASPDLQQTSSADTPPSSAPNRTPPPKAAQAAVRQKPTTAELPATAALESEPEQAVPAAEGFFASGITLPDWFPFARKGSKPAAAVPAAESAPPVDRSSKQEVVAGDDGNDEEAASSSIEPHADWLDHPRTPRTTPAVESPPATLSAETSLSDTSLADEQLDEQPDADATAATEATSEGDEEGKPKRRRSRRRGRGRGRRKEGANDEATADRIEPTEADEDESESSLERPIAKRAKHDDDGEEDDDEQDRLDDDSDDDDVDSQKSGRPSHKNIPSWLDAITGVIDANIANRGQRPRSTGSRGNARSEGRPRGGRGRGGKQKPS
jgi:ribonuclease E